MVLCRLAHSIVTIRSWWLALAILIAFAPSPGHADITGVKKIAVIPLKFLDANVGCAQVYMNAEVFGAYESVKTTLEETSYGNLTITGKVFDPVAINARVADACSYLTWGIAAKAIVESGGTDLDSYDYRFYVLPAGVTCPWNGIAEPTQADAWIRMCESGPRYLHELGHLFGLHHAGTPTSEHGDRTDFMTSSGVFIKLNAPHMLQLGLLSHDSLDDVNENATVRLSPLDLSPEQTNFPHVVRLMKPDTNEFYYVSYRRGVGSGLDEALPPDMLNRVHVHRQTSYSHLKRTYLVAALAVNQSFTDTENGIEIIAKNISTDGATVEMKLTPGCTRKPPLLYVSTREQTGVPGEQKRYAFTIGNGERAACGSVTYSLNHSLSTPAARNIAVTLSSPSVTLAPGTFGAVEALVTALPDAQIGRHSFILNLTSPAGAIQSNSDYGEFLINILPPAPPRNVLAVSKPVIVYLSWSAALGGRTPVGYKIYRDGRLVSKVSAATSLYTDRNVRSGQTYSYYVTAYDSAGLESVASSTASVTVRYSGR